MYNPFSIYISPCIIEEGLYMHLYRARENIYLNERWYDRVQSSRDDLEAVLVVAAQETGPHECENWHDVMQHTTLGV